MWLTLGKYKTKSGRMITIVKRTSMWGNLYWQGRYATKLSTAIGSVLYHNNGEVFIGFPEEQIVSKWTLVDSLKTLIKSETK